MFDRITPVENITGSNVLQEEHDCDPTSQTFEALFAWEQTNLFEGAMIKNGVGPMNFDPMQRDRGGSGFELEPPLRFGFHALHSFQAHRHVSLRLVVFRIDLFVDQEVGHLISLFCFETTLKGDGNGPVRNRSHMDTVPGSEQRINSLRG